MLVRGRNHYVSREIRDAFGTGKARGDRIALPANQLFACYVHLRIFLTVRFNANTVKHHNFSLPSNPSTIRSGQNRFARHSDRGKKTRQTEEEVGRHHQGMDRPGVRQVPEGSGEQKKMEGTGCEVNPNDPRG